MALALASARRVWFFIALILVSSAVPRAQAMDRDTRAVLVAGGYGIVMGTAAGLVTYPFTTSTRSIFIGSSIGLYMGLIAGIYHITHRDDPQNPLNYAGQGPDPDATVATRWDNGLAPGKMPVSPAPQMQLSLYRF